MATIQIKRYSQEANIPSAGLVDGEFILARDTKKIFMCTSATEKIVVNKDGGLVITDYAGIVALINGSNLVPGQEYLIADYATVHYFLDLDESGYNYIGKNQNFDNGINVGPTEPLIVKAISGNKLSNNAKSVLFPSDIIHYDWNPQNWLYDVSFADFTDTSIIPGFKGVIYHRVDTIQRVEMDYDFRNVKIRRWARAVEDWDSGTTYNDGTYAKTAEGVFISLIPNNLNNAPDLVSIYWGLVIYENDITYTNWNSSSGVGPSNPLDFEDFYTFSIYSSIRNVKITSNENRLHYVGDQYQGVKSIIKGVVFDNSRSILAGDFTSMRNCTFNSYYFEMCTFFHFIMVEVKLSGIIKNNFIAATYFSYSDIADMQHNTIGEFSSIMGLTLKDSMLQNKLIGTIKYMSVSSMQNNKISGTLQNFVAISFSTNVIRRAIVMQFCHFDVFDANTVPVAFANVRGSCKGIDFTGASRVSAATYDKELVRTGNTTAALRYITGTNQYIVAANS